MSEQRKTNKEKPVTKQWWFWFLISILVLSVILRLGNNTKNNSTETSANTTAETNNTIEKVSKGIYEDSYIKVIYVGRDKEENGLLFEITNKSDKNFSFCFDSILIDGKTEVPAYSTEIIAGSKAEHLCDVSSIDNIESLTATMAIYDSDGFEIKDFSVKNIPLK